MNRLIASERPFRPRRERLHEQVADYLWQTVVDSNLQPGDPLPSERELAEQLGVSRATVSSAIRLLEQQGLLSILVGSGTYVSDKARSVFVDSMERLFAFNDCDFNDLMVLREMIEPGIAALAAEHSTAEALAAIGRHLKEAEEAWYDGNVERQVTGDANFHEALAAATGNRLLIAITAGIRRLTMLALDAQYRSTLATEEGEAGMLGHHTIYKALVNHDPEGAQSAMVEHMYRTRVTLEHATEKRPREHSQRGDE
jgi:GntR family transcriptional repressor for pyruvate dehydrogenase complex